MIEDVTHGVNKTTAVGKSLSIKSDDASPYFANIHGFYYLNAYELVTKAQCTYWRLFAAVGP